ncbi:MAG: hypothetical protein P4M09_17145, partial [Devosia sp.]|nr:hypothetical protein [Devosia sp.]
MTDWITVKTKAEFEAALKKDKDAFLEIAGGSFTATLKVGEPALKILAAVAITLICEGSSQPHVVAWESSQPHVVARGSSQPHVVARESSQPHVEAWGSSQPHVVAWESSQPHV